MKLSITIFSVLFLSLTSSFASVDELTAPVYQSKSIVEVPVGIMNIDTPWLVSGDQSLFFTCDSDFDLICEGYGFKKSTFSTTDQVEGAFGSRFWLTRGGLSISTSDCRLTRLSCTK
jgi:hypothetical protein